MGSVHPDARRPLRPPGCDGLRRGVLPPLRSRPGQRPHPRPAGLPAQQREQPGDGPRCHAVRLPTGGRRGRQRERANDAVVARVVEVRLDEALLPDEIVHREGRTGGDGSGAKERNQIGGGLGLGAGHPRRQPGDRDRIGGVAVLIEGFDREGPLVDLAGLALILDRLLGDGGQGGRVVARGELVFRYAGTNGDLDSHGGYLQLMRPDGCWQAPVPVVGPE